MIGSVVDWFEVVRVAMLDILVLVTGWRTPASSSDDMRIEARESWTGTGSFGVVEVVLLCFLAFAAGRVTPASSSDEVRLAAREI